MSVDAVIGAWLDGLKESLSSGNAHFKGKVFISFRTPVAWRHDDIILMSERYHSQTTSRHKRRVSEKAKERGLVVVSVGHINPTTEQEHAQNVHHLRSVAEQAEASASRYSGQNYGTYYTQMANEARDSLEVYEKVFDLCAIP